ncbi:MAG: glycogen debranching protein GlgX [Weeksellaceae bacterium]|nr:glycogen debranching protein GlgX [Weeksellaceae bacterium]
MSILPLTQKGEAFPLGATVQHNGVNFSVFAPKATAVELLLFTDAEDVNPTVIPLDPKNNRSYYYWHIFIPRAGINQLYGYRVDGACKPQEGFLHDKSKVLVDPYAKAIVGNYDRKLANEYGASNLHACLKSAVISDEFDWKGDAYPKHDLMESVVYEMHVRGFTKHESSELPETIRGTFSGIREKIPYLKKLGVTAIELMPIFAFDKQDAPDGLVNYWGYSPINYFALHADYCSTQTPQEQIYEFKHLVRALHKANIEVYLDVVYNHTTENSPHSGGPTLCHRGFANQSYYMIDEEGNFRNFTGTGNTLNANHSVVRRMIMDSLRYWVTEMHVDGFRFDLASVLSRNEAGEPIHNPPILWSIDSDPQLAHTKIIAEPWDASGLYQVTDFPGDRWIIWNDAFRDSMRKVVNGHHGRVRDLALRILGSPNKLRARHVVFEPRQNLHFVTCHDGFTLRDLVSYNEKHNYENGEDNRDGNSQNFSNNYGVEGETDDQEIIELRNRQMRNFFTLLMISHGTPMISMGDEMGKTQFGNNNAYCHDQPFNWLDWNNLDSEYSNFDFLSQLINTLQQIHIFSHHDFFNGHEKNGNPYVNFHGVSPKQPDWGYYSQSLACEFIAKKYAEHYYLIVNMYNEPLEFHLPAENWNLVLDTYSGFAQNSVKNTYVAHSHSCVLLKKAVLQITNKT